MRRTVGTAAGGVPGPGAASVNRTHEPSPFPSRRFLQELNAALTPAEELPGDFDTSFGNRVSLTCQVTQRPCPPPGSGGGGGGGVARCAAIHVAEHGGAGIIRLLVTADVVQQACLPHRSQSRWNRKQARQRSSASLGSLADASTQGTKTPGPPPTPPNKDGSGFGGAVAQAVAQARQSGGEGGGGGGGGGGMSVARLHELTVLYGAMMRMQVRWHGVGCSGVGCGGDCV